jgi:cell division septum initiation protein DivIVA
VREEEHVDPNVEEIVARWNVARRAIGDLTVENLALRERVSELDMQLARAGQRAEELEVFIARLQEEDAVAGEAPEKSNGHHAPRKSAST